MGIYDFVGEIQIKCTQDPKMREYGIGSPINLPDGCYVGYEWWFVVFHKEVVQIGENIFDKWGNILNKEVILDPNNQVSRQVKMYTEVNELKERENDEDEKTPPVR